jgi:membrane-associated phospholipid phosphatase
MARFLPFIFIGLAILFGALALRRRRPGESIFSPQRRTWLLIAVIFLIVGLALTRVLRF